MSVVSRVGVPSYLHGLVRSATDSEIVDAWNCGLRAIVYRHWLHGMIKDLNTNDIRQEELDAWQSGLNAPTRMKIDDSSDSHGDIKSSSESETQNDDTRTLSKSRSSPASSKKQKIVRANSSSKLRNSRHGRSNSRKNIDISPVVIPEQRRSDKRKRTQNGRSSATSTSNSVPKSKSNSNLSRHKSAPAPNDITGGRSPTERSMREIVELNGRIAELKNFLREQFDQLKEAQQSSVPVVNHTEPIRVGRRRTRSYSGGDTPDSNSSDDGGLESPSPSSSTSPSGRRRMRMRSSSGGRKTKGNVPVLDMISETADAIANEEIMATVMASPHGLEPSSGTTPPSSKRKGRGIESYVPPVTVVGKSHLLVSPTGANGRRGFGTHVIVTPPAQSPVYVSKWEPGMSDTRVSGVNLLTLDERVVATPSPDILMDDDDDDDFVESLLAKYR